MFKKRGQYSQAFLFLLVLIIAVMLIIFGFKAISSFKEKGCQAQYTEFKTKLVENIKVMGIQEKDVSELKLGSPCGIDRIVFLDNDKEVLFDTLKDIPEIQDILDSRDKSNMFFIKEKKIVHQDYVQEIDLKMPYFLCTIADGRDIKMLLEGSDEGVILSKKDDELDCTFDYILTIELTPKDVAAVFDEIVDVLEEREARDAIGNLCNYGLVDPVEAGLTRTVEFSESNVSVTVTKGNGRFNYYESIPKCAVENLEAYMAAGLITFENDEVPFELNNDPLIMWNFGIDDKKDVEEVIKYTIKYPTIDDQLKKIAVSCLRGRSPGLFGIGLALESDKIQEGDAADLREDREISHIDEIDRKYRIKKRTELKEEIIDNLKKLIEERKISIGNFEEIKEKISSVSNIAFESESLIPVDLMDQLYGDYWGLADEEEAMRIKADVVRAAYLTTKPEELGDVEAMLDELTHGDCISDLDCPDLSPCQKGRCADIGCKYDSIIMCGAKTIDGLDDGCCPGTYCSVDEDADCTGVCIDKDDDDYGVGGACLGADCDDNPFDDPIPCPAEQSNLDCNNPVYSKCAKCVHPGAIEYCDGVDNDCDGFKDAEDSGIVEGPLFADEVLLKNTGVCADLKQVCKDEQWINDINNPLIEKSFNGIPFENTCYDMADNDCDGLTDCADSNCVSRSCDSSDPTKKCKDGQCVAAVSCIDGDNDGYGIGTELSACSGSTILNDCNDGDSEINPSATEIKDNDIDENCDGTNEYSTGFCDADADGVDTKWSITKPVCFGNDCKDNDASVYPGAIEICNNDIDNDCDGLIKCSDPDCNGKSCGTDRICNNVLCEKACSGTIPTGDCDAGVTCMVKGPATTTVDKAWNWDSIAFNPASPPTIYTPCLFQCASGYTKSPTENKCVKAVAELEASNTFDPTKINDGTRPTTCPLPNNFWIYNTVLSEKRGIIGIRVTDREMCVNTNVGSSGCGIQKQDIVSKFGEDHIEKGGEIDWNNRVLCLSSDVTTFSVTDYYWAKDDNGNPIPLASYSFNK